MELSPEDALRLNVMLSNAEAIRIDENSMTVYGLQGERELKAPLNPTGRADKYLQAVREMLAAAVLDSPGGYPVFLRRWTRMGQIDFDQLDRLLRIGEPEAVMAVVCSRGLNDELARKAWWCAPYSEHARRMLENPNVVAGAMGRVLAEHLIEHLPFETEHRDMLDTVRLVLQPGLISEEQRQKLWERGKAKSTYRVGFLAARPDDLLEVQEARADLEQYRQRLGALIEAENRYAELLHKALDTLGQSFIQLAIESMRRPADQDVVSALFNAIGGYFAAVRAEEEQIREIEALEARVEALLAEPDSELQALLDAVPELEAEIGAMLFLAHFGESLALPIFATSDAIGSVMRKKIEPVTTPLLARLRRLLEAA